MIRKSFGPLIATWWQPELSAIPASPDSIYTHLNEMLLTTPLLKEATEKVHLIPNMLSQKNLNLTKWVIYSTESIEIWTDFFQENQKK